MCLIIDFTSINSHYASKNMKSTLVSWIWMSDMLMLLMVGASVDSVGMLAWHCSGLDKEHMVSTWSWLLTPAGIRHHLSTTNRHININFRLEYILKQYWSIDIMEWKRVLMGNFDNWPCLYLHWVFLLHTTTDNIFNKHGCAHTRR